jgi:hypothetical protein
MAITQKRIYELDTFDGEQISGTWYAVDNQAWTEPKKSTLEGILDVANVEAGRLTNLGSRSVSFTFGEPFTQLAGGLKVYRQVTKGTDTFIKDVLYKNLVESLAGFSLEIDSSESLTGIVISYAYFEAQ